MSKEVAKKESTEIAELGLFEGMDSGFEGTSSQTFKTPFLKIIQSLSPERKKNNPQFLENAEEGHFCNSATRELYDSINVVILKMEHTLVVWRPERGGFVGRYPKTPENEQAIVADQSGVQKWDAEGNEIVDTIEFYCLNIDNPSDIFVFPVSTASLKHAKSFATRLKLLKHNSKPVNVTWAGVWKLSTIEESNDKGSWFTIGATPEFLRFITAEEKDNLILPAKEMLKGAETDYTIIESSGSEEDVEY